MSRQFAVARWLLLAGAAAAPSAASGTLTPPPPLFLDAPSGAAVQDRTPPAIQRTRVASINPDFLGLQSGLPSRWLANVFADVNVVVVITSVAPSDSGGVIYAGHAESDPARRFLLARSGSASVATLDGGAVIYQWTADGAGLCQISEINPAAIPRCSATLPSPPQVGATARSIAKAAFNQAAASASPGKISVIDLMVVFTAQARQGAGSLDSMNALIDLAMAEARTVIQNSHVRIQLRLVHRAEVNYVESGDLSTDLSRLADSNDGFMDEVHAWRDQAQADLTCLLVETSVSSENFIFKGIAYGMLGLSSSYESLAFSVVQRRFATGDYTFIHEIGHNFGCHHDREYAASTVIFPYAYGHRFRFGQSITYATVMAYGGVAIPHFSNPDVLYRDLPTGVPEGQPEPADNARTINNTASIVSAYRGPNATTFPPAVQILSPQSGTRFVVPANVVIQADASDADGTVRQLDFVQGTNRLATVAAASATVTWTNPPVGVFSLTVIATDNLGATSTSPPVAIQVDIPRPANDQFADRIRLEGASVSLSATNLDATKEPGEPNHAGPLGGKSVWWTWTPFASGLATIATTGSSFDTLLAVYTGSVVSNLTVVASNNNEADNLVTSRVNFQAITGTPYQIAVDGFGARSGTIQLALSQSVPPSVRFAAIERLEDGRVRLRLAATADARVAIQVSGDLQTWTDLTSVSIAAGSPFEFVDPAGADMAQRFFRAQLLP